jgi:hypothetical protein
VKLKLDVASFEEGAFQEAVRRCERGRITFLTMASRAMSRRTIDGSTRSIERAHRTCPVEASLQL